MPIATVIAIIRNSKNSSNILLVLRNTEPYKDYWCLPGGHIEAYETAKDAIIREVKEETGLDFEPNFFCYSDEILPEKNLHAVVIVFEGEVDKEPHVLPNWEIQKVKWVSITKARSLKLAFLHNTVLEAYINSINQKLIGEC